MQLTPIARKPPTSASRRARYSSITARKYSGGVSSAAIAAYWSTVAGDRRGIDPKPVLGARGDGAHRDAQHVREARVIGVKWLANEDLVAGIAGRRDGEQERLRAAHGHHDVVRRHRCATALGRHGAIVA